MSILLSATRPRCENRGENFGSHALGAGTGKCEGHMRKDREMQLAMTAGRDRSGRSGGLKWLAVGVRNARVMQGLCQPSLRDVEKVGGVRWAGGQQLWVGYFCTWCYVGCRRFASREVEELHRFDDNRGCAL